MAMTTDRERYEAWAITAQEWLRDRRKVQSEECKVNVAQWAERHLAELIEAEQRVVWFGMILNFDDEENEDPVEAAVQECWKSYLMSQRQLSASTSVVVNTVKAMKQAAKLKWVKGMTSLDRKPLISKSEWL